MAYPRASVPWTRSVASTWAARVTFMSVGAVALVLTGLALHGDFAQHQSINRADKADSLVSATALKAKHDVNLAWYQFFHDRELGDPKAASQFDGVAVSSKVRLEKVAVNDRNYFAW